MLIQAIIFFWIMYEHLWSMIFYMLLMNIWELCASLTIEHCKLVMAVHCNHLPWVRILCFIFSIWLFIVGNQVYRVYQLLGECGTYYGVRFGKSIPWVTQFPFGVIKDPQYVGSILSLFACLSWVPFTYILLWVFGYIFMIHLESKDDPNTRAKPLSWAWAWAWAWEWIPCRRQTWRYLDF